MNRFFIVQNGKYGYGIERYDPELNDWAMILAPVYEYNSYIEAFDAGTYYVEQLGD